MRTITFYSYKGGPGRSLALANIAAYLSQSGKKVFAMDLDLEAPGLHYKFEIPPIEEHAPMKGVVDYIHSFVTGGDLPESLKSFVVPNIEKRGRGRRHVAVAGW